mmetsp:Transcript_67302/g.146680  ORF Transcript_67302/g.146680 Transcript_67302/m.146680 type:complete len:713 (-) Transcript_67302:249-2387(-)|eukprot:CAMPEP_0170604718 /NCGR_PEP_ID=MMETSP0224-20130122/19576_1 /TAXON_ID=285029 /ORGANISM="Togula jolla, Strain CCCM 725" /LENGTH=712 /DNA_ID=CAMNT_0010929647 /DNA_START=88 /DNA_END=2226 /DNA_ORIENTATION=+
MSTPRKPQAKSIGHYILMKTIGEGTFGKVKLGTHILTGERVAVKVLEKERIVEVADVERVAREIHILKLIRHPHIIQLYEIIETQRQLYLIMEYASGGELFDYIVRHGRAEEREACRFLHQILAGMEKVHAMRVVHRDLKPENLLLDERKDIKIVDFGLSNTYQEGQLLQTACGSPCYAAPEMIAGQRYVPSMVDIWSCGVILFALVCGYLPFEDQNHAELYKKILNAEYEMPNFVSKEVADLISGMLNTDPTLRLSLNGIREHVWYRQMPEASIRDSENAGILDEEILEQLDNFGFPRDYAVKCLHANKHNHVTTSYFLLKYKRQGAHAEGGKATSLAIADLDATDFEEHFEEQPCWQDVPARQAAMPAAIASVATPSRGSRWEGPGVVPVSPAQGVPRRPCCPVPRLNLGDQHQASSSRSPRQPPLLSLRGDGEAGAGPGRSPSPQQHAWMPSPRPAAMEPGLWAPLSARPSSAYQQRPSQGLAGCAAGGHPASAVQRRPSCPPVSQLEPNGPVRRQSGHSAGRYGDQSRWQDRSEAPSASPRRPTPLTARPRLQGNAAEWCRGQDRQTGAPPFAWGLGPSLGRPSYAHAANGLGLAPCSARGAPSDHRDAHGHGSAPTKGNGACQVSCNSSRPPQQIIQEVLRSLSQHRISHRQVSNFLVRCQGQGARFEAEVLQQDRGGGFMLCFSRMSGDVWAYKDICAHVLADMRL